MLIPLEYIRKYFAIAYGGVGRGGLLYPIVLFVLLGN